MDEQICNMRRRLLKAGMALAMAGAGVRPVFAASDRNPARVRDLAFYNLHTGESLVTEYWADGDYLPKALRGIDHILRDYRNNRMIAIDTHLIDLMYGLRNLLDTSRPIQIISGYRSPDTNAILAAHSDGVAKGSLHMQGKAIDLYIEGVPLDHLRRAAASLHGGGVGYYPDSSFVHIDTGRVRNWG